MSFTFIIIPTVCLIFMYISFNPDRLFKTDFHRFRCSCFLRWNVSYRSPRPYYVLYIFHQQSYFFVQLALIIKFSSGIFRNVLQKSASPSILKTLELYRKIPEFLLFQYSALSIVTFIKHTYSTVTPIVFCKLRSLCGKEYHNDKSACGECAEALALAQGGTGSGAVSRRGDRC